MEGRNQRILCIDNHASRNLAVYLLERAGYEVWETSSLADGVLLAQSNHFDLYLLNHKLVPSSTIGSCNAYHELGPNPQVLSIRPFSTRTSKEEYAVVYMITWWNQ